MDSVRELALLTLCDITNTKAYVNMAVKKNLQGKKMSLEDKAFYTTLVYGVVRYRISIDQVIKRFSKVKIKKISCFILNILRLGIFQLLYTDKVPQSAAINESVKLAKRYGHSASSGYVNAVLRNVSRNEIDFGDDLSYKYSFPQWIIDVWERDYGAEICEQLLEAMNRDARMTLRVNTYKTTCEELIKLIPTATKSEIYENAVVSKGFDIANSKEYREGLFIPQDISAMMASVVLAPDDNQEVLDLCAAPGGKTTHLAEKMNNTGSVTACDIFEHKLELIKSNCERMGFTNVSVIKNDATVKKSEFVNRFDRVLCDVPCSGLGIIRKKPDIKLKEKEDLFDIQYKILCNAASYLKKGGELVYSTCTLDKTENEDVILKFLKENSEYEAVDFYGILPDKLKKDTAKKGYVTFFPCQAEVDGFFISKIKRCIND